MGKILTILAAVATLTSVLLSSCNSGGCTELRSSVPKATFYSSATGSAIMIDSLRISGIGVKGDSILYGPKERLTTILLPMPALTDTVQWQIAYMQSQLAAQGVADTLTLHYTRTPWFAGVDCGAMYKYDISSVNCTHYLIDSVVVVNPHVTNIDANTLNIYFRTD